MQGPAEYIVICDGSQPSGNLAIKKQKNTLKDMCHF